MELRIDRGLKSYEIKDADGTSLGVIRFNPRDMGIVTRAEEARRSLQELTDSVPRDLDGVLRIEQALRDTFDKIFSSSVSEVLFADVSPLAVCEDGRLLWEAVLEELLPMVQGELQQAAADSQARIAKHTAAYTDTGAGLAPGQQA